MKNIKMKTAKLFGICEGKHIKSCSEYNFNII